MSQLGNQTLQEDLLLFALRTIKRYLDSIWKRRDYGHIVLKKWKASHLDVQIQKYGISGKAISCLWFKKHRVITSSTMNSTHKVHILAFFEFPISPFDYKWIWFDHPSYFLVLIFIFSVFEFAQVRCTHGCSHTENNWEQYCVIFIFSQTFDVLLCQPISPAVSFLVCDSQSWSTLCDLEICNMASDSSVSS